MKLELEIIDEYLIKRPWEKIIKIINHENILNIFNEKGIVGDEVVDKLMTPLLLSVGLNPSITLEEFYEFTKIHFHFFTMDINNLHGPKIIDVSHKSFPKLSLYKAIRMSSAIPFLFKPVCMDNSCFIDPGFIINFPLNYCLEDTKCDPSEIMAFKNHFSRQDSVNIINDNSSIFSFLSQLLHSFEKQMSTTSQQVSIKNTITNKSIYNNYINWPKVASNSNIRKEVIDYGIKLAEEFIKASDLKTP